ncbi:Phosphatidic acid phosphatase type 2/haloperoxidase domain-containing protein [Strongyloides ratti]|uniref:Phosphatidic acid phosphatase type 2/haloperoxidase domain-containing protein n=1 Tax=Strongyloides ratti TaxID=34506 RepID=A0A090KRR9_STRRB|nr:Phosphatidic acid phosphatase type 2/haloperoxidase domain-containing protein [Strongyloides ratti]CEF60090.1 Phosphatidic acid phosphatase type 2/haloperoxidase domain-containing protein [Strongyloides ratti]
MQITIAIFTFILVTFIEYCEANILKKELLDNEESKDKSIKFHKLLFIFSIYKILVISLMGNLFVSYTIHIIKYSVGRLRPNFVDVCKPKIFNETCINGIFKYYECTSEDIKQISESRLSFFSGHAAYAFFNAIFISTYIFIRSSKKSIGKKE